MSQDVTLFDPSLLEVLANKHVHLRPSDPDLKIRRLSLGDYHRGYMELLSELTSIGHVGYEQFKVRFETMRTQPQSYYVLVVEHLPSKKIVGSASLVLEWKFIHSAGFRSRVEDVVVSSSLRGKRIGNILVGFLVALGRFLGSYKISLECKDHLVGWYEKLGFKKDPGNNFMVLRYQEKESSVNSVL